MFVLFGRIAIKIFYGIEYVNAALPLSIVCWYNIFSYLGVARNPWLICENKQNYLKYMYLMAAIANVALNFIFIPLWGASGAAFASLTTQILTGIVLPLIFKELRPNVKLILDAFLLKGLK